MAERSFKEDAQKRILIVDDDRELAELLASFFSKANFEAQFATKGKEALEIFKELRPHLVLLDILLPDLIGYEVLKRMKEPAWADQVAFIMMSGVMKQKNMRAMVMSNHGADDFIEKPFKVREMHNTILRYLGMNAIEESPEPSIPAVTSAPKSSGGAVTPLTPPAPQAPAAAPTVPEKEVTIEGGDLMQTDFPRILSAFFTAQVTGVLKVGSGDIVKAIFFESGKPVFAASKDPNDRLGEFAVREGLLQKQNIEDALRLCKDFRRLGTTLVEMKLITPHQLFELIQMQVKEIILSCFKWVQGKYAFNFEDLASRELIKCQTSPADLVLDGLRLHYSEERLKKGLVSLDRVPEKAENPAFRFQELHLGAGGTRVMDAVNGRKSLQQIISDFRGEDKEVLQYLYGFYVMKIIQDVK